jgi:hypothetical protein
MEAWKVLHRLAPIEEAVNPVTTPSKVDHGPEQVAQRVEEAEPHVHWHHLARQSHANSTLSTAMSTAGNG